MLALIVLAASCLAYSNGADDNFKGVESVFGFFFASRRRHTRFDCDWSSDVCSSDLWITSLELTFRGSVTQDPDDFLKRITYRPDPSYPPLAQRAGIHGLVNLQVKLTKDGRVEVQKVLEGEPVLADAAIDAVKRWRAKPARLNGRPCEVISTVKFDFQLPR